MVLLALVGTGAVVATGLRLLLPESGATSTRWAAWRARLAADGAPVVLDAARALPWVDEGAGDSASAAVDDGASVTLVRTALAPPWVGVEARARAAAPGAGGVWPAVARTLWRRLPLPPPAAALTAFDSVQLAADVVVDGTDDDADRWTWCPPAPGIAPGLQLADPSRLVAHPGAIVRGGPPIGAPPDADAVAAIAALRHRLDEAVAVEAPVAAITARPRTADGRCRLDGSSWGEPRRIDHEPRCMPAAPVVRVAPPGGAARVVAPTRAQGTLVVAGDLVLDAPLEFAGLLVVQGALDARAAPLEVRGAVLALGPARLGAGSRIRRGACALRGAALGAASLVRADAAGWAP